MSNTMLQVEETFMVKEYRHTHTHTHTHTHKPAVCTVEHIHIYEIENQFIKLVLNLYLNYVFYQTSPEISYLLSGQPPM